MPRLYSVEMALVEKTYQYVKPSGKTVTVKRTYRIKRTRPAKDLDKVQRMVAKGYKIQAIADKFEVNRTTIHRWLKSVKKEE